MPETALAQCGTIIALRLTNGGDQGKVKAALPDVLSALSAVLPSLRTGEAIISGESVTLPARIRITRPNPEPHAEDPSLVPWKQKAVAYDFRPAIEDWRGIYEEEE